MRGELGTTFELASVAAAYRFRPPYPDAVLDLLAGLMIGTPRRMLDLGAGDGALARPMAERADAVDAIEPSEAMARAGRALPGGSSPRLSWHLATAETFTGTGPYGLVTAGEALHWLDLPALADRLRRVMLPGAVLAVVDRFSDPVIRAAALPVIKEFSRNQDYDPTYSAAKEMADLGLWTVVGEYRTDPTPFSQTVEDHIEALHSTSSLARELMSGSEATAFDAALRRALRPFAARTSALSMQVSARVTWGSLTEAPPG